MNGLHDFFPRAATGREQREHTIRVAVDPLAPPQLYDLVPCILERQLAALEPVPRVIGVFVIGTEYDLEHLLRIGTEFVSYPHHRLEGGVGENATEIVEDRVV